MAIAPATEYPGKIATDVLYPHGKARNIAVPGDGTGTPWEAKIVNDIFGFQQKLTSLAGIIPSGVPDNSVNSQYFDALWKILNLRTTTINFNFNSDMVLTQAQQLFNRIIITDSGGLLDGAKRLTIGTAQRTVFIKNETTFSLYLAALPSGGSSSTLVYPQSEILAICDGSDIFNFFELVSGAPTTQQGIPYADFGLVGTPDTSFSPTGARLYPNGNVRGKTIENGEYIKYPDGRLECRKSNVQINRFHSATFIDGEWQFPHETADYINSQILYSIQAYPGNTNPVNMYRTGFSPSIIVIGVRTETGGLISGHSFDIDIMLKGSWY